MFPRRWQMRAVGNLHFVDRLLHSRSVSLLQLFTCSLGFRRVFVVKLRLRDNESVNEAVRRFRKLVEHAGVKKEMRKREFYEKPSDIRRRDRRRAEMRARRANQPSELEMT
jgi:small subunit ribosomal protein S21